MAYSESGNATREQSLALPEDDTDAVESEYSYKQTRRTTNVYDAVAGRVNRKGHHPDEAFASRYRDTASSGARSLRPEEVLFRTHHNPIDFDEAEYFAHERLRSQRALPRSDVLEALHAYVADFYEFATNDHGLHDHHSMDETALIALGILVEEMAKEALGETGDLVLVEGEELTDDLHGMATQRDVASAPRSRDSSQRRKRSHNSAVDVDQVQEKSKDTGRKKKRRKIRSKSTNADADTELDER
ncbi:Uncharacterized protein PECH_004542 [Penicillium ucsense]|uniref:Uncharacterized protein n=1 Tax=Penicillium ucsense TaxID=2839758 RepID=A0A8J8VX63_9EURO|nr:Uncharacterized protein PECM_001371 [Penicillium ucsense]KAF7726644.1 Uncharacterized protein PECH_004542 [Penicillium ucsense]